MKYFIVIIFTLVAIAACNKPQVAQQFYFATPQVVKPVPLLRIPESSQNFQLHYGNEPGLEKAFKHFVATGNALNIEREGFVKFAYNPSQQPIIKTVPLQETVISLEPGEKYTNISSGDPTRWSYAVAASGSGAQQQQNILIKPSQPDLSTNMVITTDRRMYNIRLLSSLNNQATKTVSFWYPEKMVEIMNEASVKQEATESMTLVPDVNLNNLNFNYALSCGWFCRAPYWQPSRVFDDGIHTYIQFPIAMTNRDMPILLVLRDNQKEIVNYRSKPPYFVVDKIFKQAILLMGVGRSQTKLIITNQSAVESIRWLNKS